MKERLNLTIEAELLEVMKIYAAGKGISVSELVENYFRNVTKPVKRRNIVDLVDELEVPDPGIDHPVTAIDPALDAGKSELSGGPFTKIKKAKHGL